MRTCGRQDKERIVGKASKDKEAKERRERSWKPWCDGERERGREFEIELESVTREFHELLGVDIPASSSRLGPATLAAAANEINVLSNADDDASARQDVAPTPLPPAAKRRRIDNSNSYAADNGNDMTDMPCTSLPAAASPGITSPPAKDSVGIPESLLMENL